MGTPSKETLRRTIDALEKSLRRYPENEKILHQLAVAYSQLGRFDPRAIKVYQKAAKLYPADAKIQRALSISYLIDQSNQIAEENRSLSDIDKESHFRNIERLRQLTREFPDAAHIHRALADLQLLQGEEREAMQHYRCAMALGITDLQSLCRHFENVRFLRDLSATASIFFAEVYQRIGAVEQADQLFQELLNRGNPQRSVLDKYGEFLQRQIENSDAQHDTELQAYYLRQLAHVCLLRGSAMEALTWARQLTTEQLVEDERLAKDLSRRLMSMEDFRQAFEFLSNVPLDEEVKSLLNEMAMLLEKRGELDTAVYILQYINENDEFARGSRRMASENNTPAADDISIEIETELQMAELHWKNRRWDKSFERYLHVLSLGYEEYRSLLEPIDILITRVSDIKVEQLIFLADFFAERRDWRRTIDFAQRVLAIDPSVESMSKQTIEACDRVLLEFPEDWDARLLLGDELLRINNLEKAIKEFRRCAEVPEYGMKANQRLAKAYLKAGDLQSALSRFRDLPVLEPVDLEQLYDLAIAFANQENYKEAFEAAKLVHEYDAGFRDIATKYAEYEERMNQDNVGFAIDPKMRELIGDHNIGRYKYMDKIGSGGMGVVHKVMDLKTNHVVAMKILREGLSGSGRAIDRFFREARIAATLHHKNIVNILDYNISNNYGQSYIAMEYVDGPSLRDIVEKKFSETVEIDMPDIIEALFWISQLCDALDATHKKGIIHRDIKPDNIMIASNDLVKITDFGIVHIEEATFTPTGALIGTPRYMSPEQVHGGRIDSRSDIYSAGIILYEVLIGSPPFISGDISYQQVNVLPTPPQEICPAIPSAVDRIIMKCLEKVPSDRYQSALELKSALDEAFVRLGGSPEKLYQEDDKETADQKNTTSQKPDLLNPLTPSWLVPVQAKQGASEEENETVENQEGQAPMSHQQDKRSGETVELESDFDMELPGEEMDSLDSDLD